MMSPFNILTIAKYERRILLRSWFFRIFALLTLLIIGLQGGFMVFNYNPFTWAFRSLPSALIYSNFFFLNIFQSIIAVFLATDFMKRDKKLNSSEVLFIRPMTNFEYLAGKTWGLLSVFLILNILVMVLTLVFVFISDQLVFSFAPLLYYFLLVSVPSLVFVIGLSFALMSILRNQPLTFILLLGYIAIILFYLGGKAGYLFDYMVFEMPVSFSEIIGFADLNYLLMHRVGYFLLGLSFIMFSVYKLNRLPGTAASKIIPAIVSVLLLVVSVYGFFKLSSQNRETEQARQEYVNLSARYFDHPHPTMINSAISVEHGPKLKANSKMTIENQTIENIDTLILSLNPGFIVETVLLQDQKANFTQNSLLIMLPLNSPMNPSDKLELEIHYSGIPDFSVCYLDHDKETVGSFTRVMTVRIDKHYGFYTNDFVLLTNESLWYPVPGIPYDPSRPAIFSRQFTNFELNVKTKPGLLPVSQGKRTTSDSINYSFSVRDPMPQITLAIGNYKEYKMDVEGIEVKFNAINGHDFYSEYFTELADTLESLLINFLDDFERPIGMMYPYPDFSLVEVPVQFASLPRSWTSTLASSQPQMVLYPEWGFNVGQADFKSSMRRVQRNSERNNEGLTDKEMQARVFSGFVSQAFATENVGSWFGPGGANPYSLFPNYFYYVNYITSDECPVLNYAFESYLMKTTDNPRQMFMAGRAGIGDNERANLMLRDRSLKQIIAEESDQEMVNRVLQAKGAYLLSWMERQINDTQFEQYLLDYLYKNSYKGISFNELSENLSGQFSIELGGFLHEWYNSNSLPAYVLGDVRVIETIDGSRSVYLVSTAVTNYSDTDGMVRFTFQTGEGRGGGGGGFMGGGFAAAEPDERIYLIGANQTAEIQIVLFDSPRSMIFNTLLSQNIPSSIMRFGLRAERNPNAPADEFVRISEAVELANVSGEYIVDNLNEGFSVYDPALDNPIRQFVEQYRKKDETEFAPQSFGQAPSTWSKMANADFYGFIERSAMVVRSGDGSKSASWETPLSHPGYYSVYTYLNPERRFGPGRGGGGGRGGGSDPEGRYYYTIYHDDGVSEIDIEVKNFETGWNFIGTFYMTSDSTKVVLSDKGGADRIVADAVRWVLQR